jgi:hypothetical protein
MIDETEDMLESCWSFPHHLRLSMRLRGDGEPVLFIESTPEADEWRVRAPRRTASVRGVEAVLKNALTMLCGDRKVPSL